MDKQDLELGSGFRVPKIVKNDGRIVFILITLVLTAVIMMIIISNYLFVTAN